MKERNSATAHTHKNLMKSLLQVPCAVENTTEYPDSLSVTRPVGC